MTCEYFFLLDTSFDVYKVELLCLKVYRQLTGFLNNSIRVYPIKLITVMLDHMNNNFRGTIFYIFVDVPLSMKKAYSNSTISSNHCAEKLKLQTKEFLVYVSNLAEN